MSASPHRTRPSSLVRVSLCCQYGQRGQGTSLMSLGQTVMMRLARAHIFWIIDKGLLESFFVVWHYVDMMDGNIQWQFRAWLRTELRVSGMTISLPGQ